MEKGGVGQMRVDTAEYTISVATCSMMEPTSTFMNYNIRQLQICGGTETQKNEQPRQVMDSMDVCFDVLYLGERLFGHPFP